MKNITIYVTTPINPLNPNNPETIPAFKAP